MKQHGDQRTAALPKPGLTQKQSTVPLSFKRFWDPLRGSGWRMHTLISAHLHYQQKHAHCTHMPTKHSRWMVCHSYSSGMIQVTLPFWVQYFIPNIYHVLLQASYFCAHSFFLKTALSLKSLILSSAAQTCRSMEEHPASPLHFLSSPYQKKRSVQGASLGVAMVTARCCVATS